MKDSYLYIFCIYLDYTKLAAFDLHSMVSSLLSMTRLNHELRSTAADHAGSGLFSWHAHI